MVEVRNIYLSANVMQNTPVKSTVEVVNLYNTPWVNNSMSYVYEETVNNETHHYYSGAFENCTNLKTVTGINGDVVNIGNAFQNCTSMTDAPDFSSIHSGFGDNAIIMTGVFSECHNLINTPDMGHMFFASSMSGAFYNCSNLVHVNNLPSGVLDMSMAFSECQKLESFESFPNLTISGAYVSYDQAFYNCVNLVNSPTIPSGTMSMVGTYYNCYNLSNIPSFPNTVVNLSLCCCDCKNLSNIPPIPNTVMSLSEAFRNCSSITSSPDMSNATNLYDFGFTFYGCTGLVNAPDLTNCTNISTMEGTFFACSNLIESPVIPNSVLSLRGTFYGCTNLASASIVPQSVTNMEMTYYACTNLASAPSVSNSVTTLFNCYTGCSRLTNTPDMNNAKSVINMYATFAFCSGLVGNIFIPSENITNVMYCFYGTEAIKNVYIPFQNNGVNTTTFNSFTSSGYSPTSRTSDGVQLFDLNSL